MKLIAGYGELQGLLADRYHADVMFSKVSDREIRVSVARKVFIKTVAVGLNVKVEVAGDSALLLTYDNGIGIDLIVSGVLKFVKNKLPEYAAMIDDEGQNRIRVHLDRIDKLEKPLQMLALRDISFTDSSVELEVTLK